MNYLFNEIIDRKDGLGLKWNHLEQAFGSEEILPMWVADMDYANPQPIIDSLKKVLDGRILGYTAPPESLYNAIIHWQKERHQMELSKDSILFSPGVVPSIALIIQALTNEQDAILIHDPVYTPFSNMITLNKRRLVRSPLLIENNQFKMNFKDIEKKFIEEKVKLFILCNPQNPGGRVWSKKELTTLAELCKKHGVLIISDEIHGDLIFSPHQFTSLVTLDPSYQDFVLTLSAATKTFNIAGVKLSMIYIQNPKLYEQVSYYQECIEHSGLNTFGYVATETAFSKCEPWLKELMINLSDNLETITTCFDTELPNVSYMKPEGTYLFWFDCSSLRLTDEELMEHFVRVGKIALNSGAAYGPGGSQYLRLNFAAPKELVEEGLKRIKLAFEN
ncbi:MalY/PatB family protein [Carnobacterium sp.]|uniref:MalY/PatB family protein n=1 Tax=Carnobacterium sp. TaxID=48221 RepID=UPI003C77382C